MFTKIENLLHDNENATNELWLGAMTALLVSPLIVAAVAMIGFMMYSAM